jgi:hypothetical protein
MIDDVEVESSRRVDVMPLTGDAQFTRPMYNFTAFFFVLSFSFVLLYDSC